jgi:hypothetical protein
MPNQHQTSLAWLHCAQGCQFIWVTHRLKIAHSVQSALAPAQFADFRKNSSAWQKGSLPTADYHSKLVALGLLAHVVALMAICPDGLRRDELLAQHTAYLQQGGAERMDPASSGWAPPEALAAAAGEAAGRASWACAMCGLRNAAAAEQCEGCDTHKMVTDAHRAEERRAQERAAAAAHNAKGAAKKKGKGMKVSMQDLHLAGPAGTRAWGR